MEISKSLDSLVVEQADYKQHQAFLKNEIRTVTSYDSPFSSALFIGSRHKGEILRIFLKVLENLDFGGSFTMVLPNSLGAGRFENLLFSIYPEQTFSHSKAKSRIFGFTQFDPRILKKEVFDFIKQEALQAPTLFNSGVLDAGSKLLAETLKGKLSGVVAEFCSGTGLLAEQLLNTNPNIEQITCYEADYHAFDIAQKRSNPKVTNAWMDITELGTLKFDTIVMNPPFHSALGEDQALGMQCIFTAIRSLRPKGSLFVVQNKHLPYLKDKRLNGPVTIIGSSSTFIVWCYAA